MDPFWRMLGAVTFAGIILNAVAASVAVMDFDADGRLNVDELRDETAVFDADSDDDGLADGLERSYDTDPLSADTDKDGIPDGSEVYGYETDPTEADSTGGGADAATGFENSTPLAHQ